MYCIVRNKLHVMIQVMCVSFHGECVKEVDGDPIAVAVKVELPERTQPPSLPSQTSVAFCHGSWSCLGRPHGVTCPVGEGELIPLMVWYSFYPAMCCEYILYSIIPTITTVGPTVTTY